MDTWPKWSQKNSPPIPGGLYPNPKWDPHPQLTKSNAPDISKEAVPKLEVPAGQPAAGSQSLGGPTLLEQPLTNPLEEGKTLATPKDMAPKLLKPAQDSIHAPLNLEVHPVHDADPGNLNSGEPMGVLKPNVPSFPSTIGGLGDILKVPGIEGPKAHEAHDDRISTISEESSLDLSMVMAGVKGTRPDPATIEGAAGVMQTGGTIKHLANMGSNSPLFM